MKGIIHFKDKIADINIPVKKRKKQTKSLNTLAPTDMPESLILQNQLKKERDIFLRCNIFFI